ncbi:toprim domain-containing protein [Pseudofrancisella aestuarii]|uniref:Toprim domain-containing protein n=1 Tax=Pseudofrancisella aestuarii TaxID=2670347 RepID=A0ABV9TD91_9GAMM|nr:toprim domain-containing protein [Pseudofrancisella aestuarii]
MDWETLNNHRCSISQGKIVRYADKAKSKNNKDIWIARTSINAYVIGNWRTGEKQIITEDKTYSYQDEYDYKLELEKSKLQRMLLANDIAKQSKRYFESLSEADENHSYLLKKNIKPVDIKQDGKRLVIPIYSIGKYVPVGELQSIQFIYPNGFKQFIKGGASKGYMALDNGSTELLILCEGYATGVSILEYLKANNIAATIVVAFNCHNLSDIGLFLRENYPLSQIEIWADNDLSGIGETKARQVAERVGAIVKLPHLTKEQQERGLTDFNDYLNLKGKI